MKTSHAIPDVEVLRQDTLSFVRKHRTTDGQLGTYRYSLAAHQPTLYSSTYTALIRSLYNDLETSSDDEQSAWAAYLIAHQDRDGLFSDPVIAGSGWYKDDPFWCGRAHLACHVLAALSCLGQTAPAQFAMVEEFSAPGTLESWLESRDWGERVSYTGNEIMNLGIILQYARDFHNDSRAGRLVTHMLDWMDAHFINQATGLWGTMEVNNPQARSCAIQAAYHWWVLYFYDRRPMPYIRQAVDSLLATQNPFGGFGWGCHNSQVPFNSSACEDIDSIDPLARMSVLTDYRRDEIHEVLARAVPWVLRNRMMDGGFVFMLDQPFEYGHPEMSGPAESGAMFPTWFRTLSLALIGAALPESPLGSYPWNFVQCPGYQFWM